MESRFRGVVHRLLLSHGEGAGDPGCGRIVPRRLGGEPGDLVLREVTANHSVGHPRLKGLIDKTASLEILFAASHEIVQPQIFLSTTPPRLGHELMHPVEEFPIIGADPGIATGSGRKDRSDFDFAGAPRGFRTVPQTVPCTIKSSESGVSLLSPVRLEQKSATSRPDFLPCLNCR